MANEKVWTNVVRAALVVVGFAPIIVVVYFALTHQLTTQYLMLLVGAELATLLFTFGLVVLHAIVTDQIRLDQILAEHTGDASISRFQLLIFTFTIALTFVYLTLDGGGKFPDIPNQVLVLLGISAGTYGVGKGLQLGLGSPANPLPQAPAVPTPQAGASQPAGANPPASAVSSGGTNH